MQFQSSVLTRIRQIAIGTIATAVLAVAATAPAVYADPGAESDDRSLTRDEIKFLEYNWHLDASVLTGEDDAAEGNPSNPVLTRDDIKFLESNWHLDKGTLFMEDHLADDRTGGTSGSSDNPSGGSEADLWLLEEPRMQLHHE